MAPETAAEAPTLAQDAAGGGQEADVFATYRYGHVQVGAGYGRFLKGAFIRHTTPGISPTYLYLFHTYSF